MRELSSLNLVLSSLQRRNAFTDTLYWDMKKVKSAVNIQRDGFDAVGISKGVVKNSTDEIVLYNAKALCPRYILLYV